MNNLSILEAESVEELFKVKAGDNHVYGPVTLAVLQDWIRDDRVQAGDWVFTQSNGAWRRAETISSLASAFNEASRTQTKTRIAVRLAEEIEADELRQFPQLARLDDKLLEQVRLFGELCVAPAGSLIIRKGDTGDALYLVLSGQVRVRLMVGKDDKTLLTINPGQFFGEMALFNEAPRSADVVAVTETRLMRVTQEAFRLFVDEIPQVASPVLFNLATTMADRLVAANTRFQRDCTADFLWR